MRALVLHGPLHLRVEDRPPAPLAPGRVRVALVAAGVCSSDLPRVRGDAGRFPLVLGHELAGIVAAHADLPGAPAVGTPVTIFPLLPCFACPSCVAREYARCLSYDYFGSRRDGGFATHLDVPPWNLLPLPPGVDLRDGALVEPLAVVVHALSRLGDAPSVAIVGDGFLALLAVEVLRRRAAPPAITVFGRHPDRLARAAALGARTVLVRPTDGALSDKPGVASNGSSDPTASALPVALEAGSPAGAFPAVLEAAGSPESFSAALRLAAPGGRVVWMGNPVGDLRVPASLLSLVLRRELTILGTWNSRFDGGAPSDWTDAVRLIAAGLRPSVHVSHSIALDEAPALLLRLARPTPTRGRSATTSPPADPVLKALITLTAPAPETTP